MTNEITHTYTLDLLCKGYAEDIVAQCGQASEMWDRDTLTSLQNNADEWAHQYADSSEHVIYYHKALQIVANCNTDQGEQFVEDMGEKYDDIRKHASAVVYGEIYSRTMQHLSNEMDRLAECDELLAEEV